MAKILSDTFPELKKGITINKNSVWIGKGYEGQIQIKLRIDWKTIDHGLEITQYYFPEKPWEFNNQHYASFQMIFEDNAKFKDHLKAQYKRIKRVELKQNQ